VLSLQELPDQEWRYSSEQLLEHPHHTQNPQFRRLGGVNECKRLVLRAVLTFLACPVERVLGQTGDFPETRHEA
jgi:hypothetical protein